MMKYHNIFFLNLNYRNLLFDKFCIGSGMLLVFCGNELGGMMRAYMHWVGCFWAVICAA